MLRFSGSSDIKQFVRKHLESRSDLDGKVVVDIPAGSGYTSRILRDRGATVRAYDLFPEFFDVDGLTCQEADLLESLPIEDRAADIAVFQEGIEHLPNQLAALREFNRILKSGGRLLVTTPNISHLRAKISNVLTESELTKRMPPNELDALWFSAGGKMYFGHVFLIGIQRLRVLAVASGFRLLRVHTVKASGSSLLLGVLYPLCALVNGLSYLRNVYRKDGVDQEQKRRVYGEVVRLNLHPTILFGRHLFLEFEKIEEAGAVEFGANWGSGINRL